MRLAASNYFQRSFCYALSAIHVSVFGSPIDPNFRPTYKFCLNPATVVGKRQWECVNVKTLGKPYDHRKFVDRWCRKAKKTYQYSFMPQTGWFSLRQPNRVFCFFFWLKPKKCFQTYFSMILTMLVNVFHPIWSIVYIFCFVYFFHPKKLVKIIYFNWRHLLQFILFLFFFLCLRSINKRINSLFESRKKLNFVTIAWKASRKRNCFLS